MAFFNRRRQWAPSLLVGAALVGLGVLSGVDRKDRLMFALEPVGCSRFRRTACMGATSSAQRPRKDASQELELTRNRKLLVRLQRRRGGRAHSLPHGVEMTASLLATVTFPF